MERKLGCREFFPNKEGVHKVFELAQSSETAWTNAMGRYEQYTRGEFNREAFRVELDATYEAKAVLSEALEQKAAYDKKYSIFRKLLSACEKRIALSKIIDCIDRIVVDADKKIREPLI